MIVRTVPNLPACLNCGTTDEALFPLARPRRDGTRAPFAYCDACLALPQRVGGGREAYLRGKRESARRCRAASRAAA